MDEKGTEWAQEGGFWKETIAHLALRWIWRHKSLHCPPDTKKTPRERKAKDQSNENGKAMRSIPHFPREI
jgi:hypothetical protein